MLQRHDARGAASSQGIAGCGALWPSSVFLAELRAEALRMCNLTIYGNHALLPPCTSQSPRAPKKQTRPRMHNIDLPSRGTNSAILLHVCVVGNRSKQRHGDCTTTWQRVPGRDHWQFPVSFSPPYLSSSARAPGLNERPPLTTTIVISHAPRLYDT